MQLVNRRHYGANEAFVGVRRVTALAILATVTLIKMLLRLSCRSLCGICGSHVQSMILSFLIVAVPVL